MLAEVRGIGDRAAEGVSQGRAGPVRVEDVERRDCLAERAPARHDHAHVDHWGPVVQAVAAQGALDRLATRNGVGVLLDGRRRPRLADHPDWALTAATGAELDGNGVFELPQLDKRREVVVVQRQASALVLVEQEGMEAEVARTLRQDEDSGQQPRHDPIQRDRLQPERVAPRSHVERRLDPLGRPWPPVAPLLRPSVKPPDKPRNQD